MALTSKINHLVPPTIKERGYSYYASGAVSIINGDRYFLEARVNASEVYYDVLIFREGSKIYTKCSCPYFNREIMICKHIWATLLAAEAYKYLTGDNDEDPTALHLYFSEGYSEKYDDYDEERYKDPFAPLFNRNYLSSKKLREMISLGASNRKARWPDYFKTLKESLIYWKQHEMISYIDQEIVYVVDMPITNINVSKGITIELSYRQLTKKGRWGKIKPLKESNFKIEKIPNPEDRHIISILMGGQRRDSYKSEFHFTIPQPLQEYLMRIIVQTGRCFIKNQDFVIEPEPLKWDDKMPYEFILDIKRFDIEKSYKISGYLKRGDEKVYLDTPLFLVPGGLLFFKDRVAPFIDNGVFEWIKFLRTKGWMLVPYESKDLLIEELISMPIIPHISMPDELRYEEVHITPRPRLRVLRPEREDQFSTKNLRWILLFDYNGHIISFDDPACGIQIEKEPRKVIIRDRAFENEAYNRLRTLGFKEIRSYTEVIREIGPEDLPPAIRELLSQGWYVEAEGKIYRYPGVLKISVKTGIDWFEVYGEVDFGGRPARLPELLLALKRGENLIPLGDGTFGILPEDWLKKYGILTDFGSPCEDHLRFSRCYAGLLDALLASQPESNCDEVFQRLREEIRRFDGIKPCNPPEGFKGELRDYQKLGLGWFHFLQRFGFGGCLADDMGLGKTVQVLALLEERRELRARENKEGGDSIRPSLVVAPKSLVFNWIEEARRFTPNLRVLDHTGIDRLEPGKHFENYDLIITTYGTLRQDALEFKDIEFDYCILDEGQMIKNFNTQSAKAARLIKARHRLVLSGTPIENHLGELLSIFEFLNPGMIESTSVFNSLSKDLMNPDGETRELLAKALRPFILRRTKSQVASELPERTEQTIYCELDSIQRRLYDELRDHYRQSLLSQVDLNGIKSSKIQILEALLRLRQAACHPGLIDRSKLSYPSAKLETLLPQIEEIIEENYKALVFSQFTSFLSILRKELDSRKIAYAYLDGKTQNRKDVVERFKCDKDCKLFLISLKAGGLGLNLTEAEYVFLLDPWWNPAVEAQAIDRTHRIGQTRKVFAYRIIAKDTVEEKVLELQKRKRELAESIINADNSLIRDLTREDLELLLS